MRYGFINSKTISEKHLSCKAIAVYLCIACFINEKTEEAYPSIKRICMVTGLSKSTVCKAVCELEMRKIISVHRAYKQNNTYVITNQGSITIDFDIVGSRSLSYKAKSVYALIKCHNESITIKDVMRSLGLSYDTVVRIMKELVFIGLVKPIKNNNHWLYVSKDYKHYEPVTYGTTKVSSAVIKDTSLSTLARAIYIHLLRLRKSSCDSTIVVSNYRLMKRLGCRYRAVVSAIKELIHKGYIAYERVNNCNKYTLLEHSKPYTSIDNEIIDNFRISAWVLLYYAVCKSDRYWRANPAYFVLLREGYVSSYHAVNLKKVNSNKVGHRLNIQKKLNLYPYIYINPKYKDEAILMCSSIEFDYRNGGKLYNFYCRDNKIDLDHLFSTYNEERYSGLSMTKFLYSYMKDDYGIEYKTHKNSGHLSKASKLKILKSRTALYNDYMDITVVGKTTGGYYCRNNRTSDIVEISSARIQLFSGCSYIAKMKFLVDPATKTEHPVVQFAYNYKEEDAA